MVQPGYTLIGQLHAGPHYITYRAVRGPDSQPVVLKTFRAAYPPAQALNRLRQEFGVLQSLEHENRMRVLALEPFENSLAMVCEEVPGIPLSRFTSGRPVPLPVFMALALPLTRAIQWQHRQRIIHKNIAPANIIIDPATHLVTLCGFSRATILARDAQFATTRDTFEADLAYISPEQTGRMNRALDLRTDLYSLGCVFYEILTGQPPFVASDPMEIIHAHLALPPLPVRTRQPDVPPVLAEMVERLLAKSPENRYQSAAGLLADLDQCQNSYAATQQVPSFAIGSRDVSDQFQIPGQLYGRAPELQQLMAAFRRAAAGQAAVVFVGGYSGVGKSELVRELRNLIGPTRGFFISGKFDQFKRDVPLSSLLAAFRGLIRQLLADTDLQTAHWRQHVLAAVGVAGQVLVDVLPDLALLIGPQPAVPALPPAEASNRFNQLFDRFVDVFIGADRPLVLFLDDLQWIDSATRQWVETRLSNPNQRHLLFIGAYRNNEVSASHPLTLMLDRLGQRVAVDHLHLQPLDQPTLGRLIADTLVTTPDRCADLTEIIFRKTGGNPFFSRQCLLSLYEEGAIWFVADRLAWAYDPDRVQQAGISDNVLDLMIGLIQRLPAEVQQLLMKAACLGNQFDTAGLSQISQQPVDLVARQLATAQQQGLIVPVHAWNTPTEADAFTFLHDRVQQATLSLLPAADRQATRLRIGRLLRQSVTDLDHDDRIYDLADHLNAALPLLDDPDEIRQLIDINLAASIRAKNSTAYEPALRYCQQAMALLPETAWQQPSSLTSELLLQRAESEHLCGNDQPAEAYFDRAAEQATAILDKARIYQRKIHYYTNLGKFELAYHTGRAAVRPLGVRLPAAFSPPLFAKDLIEYRWLLGRRRIESIIDLPVMTDERLKMAVLLIATFLRAAYQIKPQLCIAVCTRTMNICLRHGNTDGGSNGFLAFGPIFLGAILRQKKTGFAIGQLALALVEKFRSVAYKAETYFVTGYFAVPWQRPAQEMERYWQIAYEAGLETGDLFHASCACCGTIQSYYMRGMNFDAILVAADRYREFLRRVNNQEAILTLQAVTQSIRNLRGQTVSPTSYTDEAFDEAAYLAQLGRFGIRSFAHYYFINKMQTLYCRGEYEQAYALSLQSDGYLKDSPGMLHTAEHFFYKALIICAIYPTAHRFQRLKWKRILLGIRADFQKYSVGSPACFSHKMQLLQAEICRIDHDLAGAESLYYAAVDSARQYEYRQIQALASERLVSLHAQAGRRRVAGSHLRDADYAFRQLGATALADNLRQRYPALLDQVDERETAGATTTTGADAGGLLRAEVGNLDLDTVLKSSAAISREIRLPDLLAALMKIIIENAGGQRMVFLLQRADELVVQAECLAGGSPVEMLAEVPLNEYPDIARSVVNYVARTLEPVILEEAGSSNFTADVYVQTRQPRSVLCAPLVLQGNLIGVIYLENNLVGAAFTQERIDLLSILSGQMAISVENALLYKNLEEKVHERTAALNQSLDDLRATQTQLVQKEKMASLGELMAGIAHEIQNPLNFVNNFSEVSAELVDELADASRSPIRDAELETDLLSDLKENLQKITHHGGRAAAIVRGMLDHSRLGAGEHQLTNINALCREYFRLAHHAVMIRYPTLTCALVTDLDAGEPHLPVVAQDIGRVVLNLAGNAFYAVYDYQKTHPADYQPTVTLRTKRTAGQLLIELQDNGTGMSETVQAKIFQPFFTTKPTGEGTGLGLSLSYDIVTKGHGGQLTVSSREAEGTLMTVGLPWPA